MQLECKTKNIIVAELSFKIFAYFGIWRPTSWTSNYAIRLYNIYSIFALAFMYFYTLSLLITIFQNSQNAKTLQCIFFFSVAFLLTIKITYICVYREKIITFTNIFVQGLCAPRNNEESAIFKNSLDKEWLNSMTYLTFNVIASTLYVLSPLKNKNTISLPYECWVPFDINSKFSFLAAYLYQSISISVTSILYTCVELLAPIMMQQVCTQLEILINRMLEIPKLGENCLKIDIYKEEKKLMKECINHHIFIFTIEKQLNKIFGFMVFLQFFVSTMNLCSSAYYLTKINPNDPEFITTLQTLFGFIFQVFLYCWFGEKMIRKSLSIADEIYKMNWNLLSSRTKQKLIIIMIRARKPIQLTGSSLIAMSIETFLKIMKTSYSAFNLVRNTN